jgi:plasmid maintenance system antidote protein VapI
LSEGFWVNLQTRYNLEIEKEQIAGALEKIKPWARAA